MTFKDEFNERIETTGVDQDLLNERIETTGVGQDLLNELIEFNHLLHLPPNIFDTIENILNIDDAQ